MSLKTMTTYYRSSVRRDATSSDCRNSNTPANFASTILQNRTNQTGNGYYGGHHGGRGRGGYNGGYGGNRYHHNEGDISAACTYRQQMHMSHNHAQSRNRGVSYFPASAASTSSSVQHQQPTDREEHSEIATIIWCEGGIGEVMSPTAWRHPNLHIYFDATKTVMEGKGGWGLTTELQPGMEMDVTFSMSQKLQYQLEQQSLDMESGANLHTFVCIRKITELRIPKKGVLTHEQAVVIAKRASGAVFLINNIGERTVLHPNFLPLDDVRHAILEKAEGQRSIRDEVDGSPSSLCVMGRSLVVRLAPAPSWLPTIYPTDRGVTRWALSADSYGEEKQGRAVVVQSSRHSVTLCPVEGDLAGQRTTLHAPIIQMTPEIKSVVQEVGSCWRFRACRELPGRSAVWRAFHIEEERESDPPIAEEVIEEIVKGNQLIELGQEEHWVDPLIELNKETETPIVQQMKVSSTLDDLSQLQLVFARPPSAATTDTPLAGVLASQKENDDEVLVFDSIDDILESESFAADIFKAPTVLPDEWLWLGVPPNEAIRTEQEMLAAEIPRVVAVEREYGKFTMGDERPDMRVKPKMKKKKKYRAQSAASDEDMENQTHPSQGAVPVGDSQPQNNEPEFAVDEKNSKERKRETKEDSRLKKHLASITVNYTAVGEDVFDILHGGAEEEPVVPEATLVEFHEESVEVAATSPPIGSGAVNNDLFELLHSAEPVRVVSSASIHEPIMEAAPHLPTQTPSSAASVAYAAVSTNDWGDLPMDRPRAPRFNILPYPDRPKFADGWWFRPTRPRPPPVESAKERRKKKREAEEKWRKEQEEDSDSDVDVPRQPADDLRARLLGTLKKNEESKMDPSVAAALPLPNEEKTVHVDIPQPPIDDLRARLLGVLKKKEDAKKVSTEVKPVELLTVGTEEAKKEDAGEHVLVDLSPVTSETVSVIARVSTPLLQSPAELHNDLKDLF